jgi:exodeoxyribonuclease VIII
MEPIDALDETLDALAPPFAKHSRDQPSEEVMLDLETLSLADNGCILSIGAVKFNPRTDEIFSHFEVFINPQSCTDVGLVIDAGTVMWWMESERDAARKELMACPRLSLVQSLSMFSAWMKGDRPVWGCGSDFDNVLLRNAYKAAGLDCPWEFWNNRCYRTMKAQFPNVKKVRKGTLHSAAADALTQAVHLQAIFKSLSGEK